MQLNEINVGDMFKVHNSSDKKFAKFVDNSIYFKLCGNYYLNLTDRAIFKQYIEEWDNTEDYDYVANYEIKSGFDCCGISYRLYYGDSVKEVILEIKYKRGLKFYIKIGNESFQKGFLTKEENKLGIDGIKFEEIDKYTISAD